MKLEFESNTSTLPYVENNYPGASFETGAAKASQMLLAGIKAAQAGNRSEARQLLIQVTEAEPHNETAWLWMASISEYPEELIIFLNNVLNINPNNARALEWMKATRSLLSKTFVQRGIDASNGANKDFARQCFLQAIFHDPESEMAWFWLASISNSAEEKIAHLQKVLNLNPENKTAQASLQKAKNQVTESVLRKARSAVVEGNHEAARKILQEVFKHTPDLEEAWILKSSLADSFSEKITCFERVLTINPENEMAISGLASLRATMTKTEAKKVEQGAMIADTEKFEEDENYPTQALEFPPDFTPHEFMNEDYEAEKTSTENESNEVSKFNNTKQIYGDTNQEQELFPQSVSEPSFADDAESAKNEFMNYDTFNARPATPNEATQIVFADNSEATTPSVFADTYSESREELSPATVENIKEENAAKPSPEIKTCPFCSAENELNAFVCASCRTILTLSDLEMLLAYTEADREMLRGAVERMEAEKATRALTADELKNLAIGQINLKNLRQGVAYLQKAAKMNPNDVVLGSIVNSLKIRLSEIEQQESHNSTMSKDRRILIVDDSATVRKLISSKLEKSGHEVVCAVDGIDAMDKLKEFIPDLILLDIMMPQLDGYQVCKLIRTNEITKDLPIVMISGKDGFFDKVRGRMAGATGYITKPFGPETLMKTVETYIVHHAAMLTDEIEMQN